MKTLTLLTLAASSLLLPATSAAEPPNADLTEYSFEDTRVDGALRTPLGEKLVVRQHGDRESLIRARNQFIIELLHSVEDLPAR